MSNRSTLGTVVTWIVVGILAIVTFRIALWALKFLLGVAGMVLGLVLFLVFTLGPIVLIGWLVMKLWKAFTEEPAV